MKNSEWVGVDCHKSTLACYKGKEFKEFAVTSKGFESALIWAGKDSKWAIEGAYCFGKPFTAYLVKNGCEVYEVNPLLTKTWRKGFAINGIKNDAGDAKTIVLLANSFPLQPVSLVTAELKELLSTRKFFVKQRTDAVCHIKMLLSTRGDSLPFNDLTTKKASKYLQNQDDILIKNLGKQLESLNFSIKEIEEKIEEKLPDKARELTVLTGVKTINAAVIYTELKSKKMKKEQLASYAGVAPVENSSGKKNNHFNNKGGNRILNSVFYQMSLHQSRYDEEGKRYYEKKLSEGKSPRHARKCLARQLVNQVCKILDK